MELPDLALRARPVRPALEGPDFGVGGDEDPDVLVPHHRGDGLRDDVPFPVCSLVADATPPDLAGQDCLPELRADLVAVDPGLED
ncbi:MAG: hypothetical protein V5A43_00355 [Haloarculaceae archaeon]